MALEQGFTLSVEELAMGVALLGFPEDASRILQVEFGQLQPEVARAYLDAASHSMIARGWITWEEGTARLLPALAERLTAFVETQFSLLLQKRPRQGPATVLSFHFHPRGILAHLLSHDVVHHLAPLSPKDILAASLSFLEIPSSQWEGQGTKVGILNADAFRSLLRASSQALLHQALSATALSPEVQGAIEEDFLHARYRATLLLVKYDPERRPFSEEGAFLLQGPERAWFFVPILNDDNPSFEVYPFTLSRFRTVMQTLLEKGRAHLRSGEGKATEQA